TLAKKGISRTSERLWKRVALGVQQLKANVAIDPARSARAVAHLEAIEDVSGCRAGAEQGDLELVGTAPLRSARNRSERIDRRGWADTWAQVRGSRGHDYAWGGRRRWRRRLRAGLRWRRRAAAHDDDERKRE